jgi:DNA-binding beta-propeller fold protein YncE
VLLEESGVPATLVDGFVLGTYSPFDVGPLSLAWAPDGSLVVGEGGERFGRERISFYAADGTPGPDALTPRGGADFFDVIVEPATGRLFVASTGSDRILVAEPDPTGGFAPPTDFVTDTTAAPFQVAAPAALAFDTDGRLLVGFADEAGGSILALDPDAAADSVLLETVVAETDPVLAVAIRPSDLAVVYATLDGPLTGSIHVLPPDEAASTLASGLPGPTDLVFDADDVLYATLLGDAPNADTGQVVRIEVVEITTNGVGENANAEPQVP